MKRSGLLSVCVLVTLPLVLAGPTCQCPIKQWLAPEKPAAQPARPKVTAATHSPAKTVARPVVGEPTSLSEAVSRARTQHKAIYLEFSANWCIPCRLYKSSVLTSDGGRQVLQSVVFFPVNIDKDPELAGRFDVTAVPTGLLLQPGSTGDNVRVVNRHVGALSLDKLRTFLGHGG